jgi:hypothetical protein
LGVCLETEFPACGAGTAGSERTLRAGIFSTDPGIV